MFRLLPISLLALASCSSSAGSMRDDGFRSPLFQITKNENANYVVYDLVLDGTGRLADDPLDVYWIMEATDGSRAELNSIEEGVYGVAIEELAPEEGLLGFTINAMESKRFDVDLSSAEREIGTYTTIDGQRAKITQIHLFVRPTWNPFSPDVEIQLAGLTGGKNGQEPVTELIRD